MSRSCFNLNSIMILLIHRPIRRISLDLNKFKFHYDSINSAFSFLYRKLAFIDLNSIMILLIQLKKA